MGQTDTYVNSLESRPEHGSGQVSAQPQPSEKADTAGNRAAVASVLRSWRAIERQLAGMTEGSPGFVRAQEECVRLRDEYHRLVKEGLREAGTDDAAPASTS